MQELFLGEVIRQRRLELGLTQEEVCEGICEPMTISRFENGRQTPARNRVHALLYRLGLPDDRFYGVLSRQELEIQTLEEELKDCHVRFLKASPEDRIQIREETLGKHRRLEAVMSKDDTLSKQLILLSSYLVGTESGPFPLEQGLPLLLDALCLTSPRFRINRIEEGLYTDNEIRLIHNLGVCFGRGGRHEESIDVFRRLLRYIRKNLQKVPMNRDHLPLLTFCCAKELVFVRQLNDAARVAEYGRKLCIDYGYYQHLADLLAVLAECRHDQGDDAESRELYRQAFYLYQVANDGFHLDALRTQARDFLGLVLQ